MGSEMLRQGTRKRALPWPSCGATTTVLATGLQDYNSAEIAHRWTTEQVGKTAFITTSHSSDL